MSLDNSSSTSIDQYNTNRVFYHLLNYNTKKEDEASKDTILDWYRVIDVATLSQTLSPIKKNDAYVINLEVLDIKFRDFQKIFYPNVSFSFRFG